MQDPLNKQQDIGLSNIAPAELLKGETPRLIDEWQIAPNIWDAVRQSVDERGLLNQFILPGSSVPTKMDKDSHSGTGRIVSLQMRTMSLYESSDSNGKISLFSLFYDKTYNKTAKSDLSFEDIRYLICRGGWPLAALNTAEVALQQAIDYYEAINTRDIIDVDGVRRSSIKSQALLKVYSRHIATAVTNKTILANINKNDQSASMSSDTLVDYIEAFK